VVSKKKDLEIEGCEPMIIRVAPDYSGRGLPGKTYLTFQKVATLDCPEK
jgi:hypothetical protein